MRPLWLLLLAAVPSTAGMIRGIVLENRTGRPLSRAAVLLSAVTPHGMRQAGSTFTDRAGAFFFPSVEPGYYILGAQRNLFAPALYGQKRSNGRGEPIKIGAETDFFTELRLKRLPVITGTIFDENRVGLDSQSAILYPEKPPYRVIATTKTDDRGVYRLAGLPAGRYLVRSGPYELPDGQGMVPTFHPGFLPVKEAKPIAVDLDNEYPDVDILPLPGKLSRIGVSLACVPVPGEVIVRVDVTLSTDTGNRTVASNCDATVGFEGLAPGHYELLAEAVYQRPKSAPTGGPIASFRAMFVDRDIAGITLELKEPPKVWFQAVSANLKPGVMRLSARRKDLAGYGQVIELPLHPGLPVPFTPGYWDFCVIPETGRVLTERFLNGRYGGLSKAGPSEDWLELAIPLNGPYSVMLELSSNVATIGGRVMSGTSIAPYAPVFVIAKDLKLRQRMNGYRMVMASDRGDFKITDLPSGEFLVASSRDLEEITADSLAAVFAKLVPLKESESAVVELDLHELK